MEKLLLQTKTKGGNYAGTVTGQRTKNIFFSCEWLRNYFVPNTPSTTFKINLSQDDLP